MSLITQKNQSNIAYQKDFEKLKLAYSKSKNNISIETNRYVNNKII